MLEKPAQNSKILLFSIFLLAALAWNCGDSDESSDTTSNGTTSNGTTATSNGTTATSNGTTATSNGTTATSNGVLPEGCDALVEPSDNDQDALQLAFIEVEANQTLCLAAGTYTLTQQLTLGQDNIVLRGAGATETILDFGAQDIGANGIAITGDDVTVEDLQVLNTPGDGIRATDTNNIVFRRVHVLWTAESSVDNGAYGLYPVGCTGVLIEESLVVGARDAGIYVGQSNQVIVRHNEARGNVAGIEIENTLDADVHDNHAHDNTGGILVFDLPGLDQFGARAKVHNNLIENNNRENFAEEGSIVGVVPPGTGILVLACDGNEFHDNMIQNNNSAGLILVSFSQVLTGRTPDDPTFDLFPQGNYIHDNTFTDNGTAPDPLVAAAASGISPVPDIVWDGCIDEDLEPDEKDRNCVQNNGTATYLNFGLLCGGENVTDLAEVDCEHAPLPRIAEQE